MRRPARIWQLPISASGAPKHDRCNCKSQKGNKGPAGPAANSLASDSLQTLADKSRAFGNAFLSAIGPTALLVCPCLNLRGINYLGLHRRARKVLGRESQRQKHPDHWRCCSHHCISLNIRWYRWAPEPSTKQAAYSTHHTFLHSKASSTYKLPKDVLASVHRYSSAALAAPLCQLFDNGFPACTSPQTSQAIRQSRYHDSIDIPNEPILQ